LDDSTPAEITKLDAFSKTVEGKVDSWKSAGGYYSYITIDGVEYKVAAEAVPTTQSIVLGANAVLTLNTNNEVVAVVQSAQYATAVIGEFDSLYSQATAAGTKYFFTLKDGISYDITDVADKIYKNLDRVNEVAADGEDGSELKAYAFDDLTAADLKDGTVKIQYNAAGKVIRVDVFTPFETTVKKTATNKALAGFTTYTTNGTGYTLADGAAKYVVTWDVAVGFAKNINAVTAAPDTVDTKAVTEKGTDLTGNYIVVDNTKYYFTADVSSMYDEINVGDKVSFTYYTDSWDKNFITEIEITIKAAPGETPSLPDTTYTVTYINSTATRVVIDHTITLIFDSDTEIKDEDGHIIAVGYEDIIELQALEVNDEVKDIVIVDGVVASLVKVTE
jgi:hypothetical protein